MNSHDRDPFYWRRELNPPGPYDAPPIFFVSLFTFFAPFALWILCTIGFPGEPDGFFARIGHCIWGVFSVLLCVELALCAGCWIWFLVVLYFAKQEEAEDDRLRAEEEARRQQGEAERRRIQEDDRRREIRSQQREKEREVLEQLNALLKHHHETSSSSKGQP